MIVTNTTKIPQTNFTRLVGVGRSGVWRTSLSIPQPVLSFVNANPLLLTTHTWHRLQLLHILRSCPSMAWVAKDHEPFLPKVDVGAAKLCSQESGLLRKMLYGARYVCRNSVRFIPTEFRHRFRTSYSIVGDILELRPWLRLPITMGSVNKFLSSDDMNVI